MTPTEPTNAWLSRPAIDDGERAAKEWLILQSMRPLDDRYKDGVAKYKVTVEWRSRRYICTGSSCRDGELLAHLNIEGFDDCHGFRANVEELSNWQLEQATTV